MKKYFYEIMTDQRKGLLARLLSIDLLVFSLVYGIIVVITRSLYQLKILPVYKASKPVVSIGNITMGGTGKTPLVIALIKLLKHKGIKTAVLSRGYGSKDGNNDEIMMFQQQVADVPIYAGSNRGKSIEKAMISGLMDVFIADDAFSHWPLSRDLDIVTIDASNPIGNGHLIPRGILREPISALYRADVFVLTKTELIKNTDELLSKLKRLNSKALIVEAKHTPLNMQDIYSQHIYTLDHLKNKKVAAFCAIAQPKSFEHSLKSVGIDPVEIFTYEDHYIYTRQDVQHIVDEAKKQNINILVTTHKDAVKMGDFKDLLSGLTVVQLNIELTITHGQEELVERIVSLQSH